MTYGLQITGTDGSTVFSVIDTDENPTNYVVAATGTGSTVNIANEVGSGGEARLFFAPTATGDPITAEVSGGVYNFKRYSISEDTNGNVDDATVITQSVNWLIIKDSPNVAVNTAIDDYGIQIFKSDGVSISFDSRRLPENKSFRILGVEGIRSLGGDAFDGSGNSNIGTTFNESNTYYYVEATNLFYEDNGSGGEAHGFVVQGSTTSRSLHHSFFIWNYTGAGGRFDFTRYISNAFPVVYGELR